MASNVTRDHHNLRRNLNLNDNYISNDGGNEGIRIIDAGRVGIGVTDPDSLLEIFGTDAHLKLSYDASNYAVLRVADDGHLSIAPAGTDPDTSIYGSTINLDSSADITLDSTDGSDILLDAGRNITLRTASTGQIYFDSQTGIFNFQDATDADDAFKITVVGGTGATTLETISDGADGHINIVADGHVEFDGCGVGFDLVTPTYDATSTVVDFRTGNKQFVTFDGGDITNLQIYFPAVSGNFVLLLKQDGTGSRTVTNWKVYDSGGSAASGSGAAKFAGLAVGGGPTLTTTANYVDILSFFWDSDNEFAYGVASLDFRF